MRFLILGDVVGRPGREAVSRVLPLLRKEHQPDLVIVNIENMAHGNGISPATMAETKAWQVDAFTTGDHAWDNEQGVPLLDDKKLPIIRPANYPPNVPGRGYLIISSGAWHIAVINLQGQVFFKNQPQNPFLYIDELLKQDDIQRCQIKLVDFHTEATSEVRAFGWYVDGRISAAWGTHTHVPTADAQVLPAGTGYITDVGMNGNYHSVIGVDRSIVRSFLTQLKHKRTFDDAGPLEVGGLLLEIDPTSGRTTDIAQIRKILNDT